MTRGEAIKEACDILDELGEREVQKYLDRNGYSAALEDELWCEVARWKVGLVAEIEKRMSATVRSMLH